MESIESIKLLIKFSNAHWILSFYGDFEEWHLLMLSLWKRCYISWHDNNTAFSNALEHTRRTLKINKSFNHEIEEFLLEHSRYKRYLLELMLNSDQSIKDFINFINKIETYSLLKFKKITVLPYENMIESYNNLWSLFIENSKLDISTIQNNNPDFNTYLQFKKGIYYMNHLNDKVFKLSSELKSVGILEIQSFETTNLTTLLWNTATSVHTILISSKLYRSQVKNFVINPCKIIQESVRCISINDMSVPQFSKLESLLSEFIVEFPKVNTIEIQSLHTVNDLISNIVNLMNRNTQFRQKFNKLTIGKRDDNNWTIIKNFPRIYVYWK